MPITEAEFKKLLPLLTEQLEELDQAPKLTEWEVEFVDSINRQIGEDKILSDKQIQTIHEIHHRHCKK